MSDEGPQRAPTTARRKPTRKLSLGSRVRGRVRRIADQVLAADAAWSATLVVVTLLLIGSGQCGRATEQFVVGQIAPYDIKASYDIDVVDDALTGERRQQAREEILDVYVHDAERRLHLAQELSAIFRDGRAALEDAELRGVEDGRPAVERKLGGRAPAALLPLLADRLRFDRAVERSLTAALTEVMDHLVIGNKSVLERQPAVVLMRIPGQRAQRVDDYSAVIEVEEARADLTRALKQELSLPAGDEQALTQFAASFIDANVHLDSEATYRRRESAAKAVPPVVVRVAQGDLVIRRGERITEDVLETLNAARRDSASRLSRVALLGWSFALGILAFCAYRYCSYHQRGFRKLQHLHALFVLMLLSMLLLAKAILWLAAQVVDSVPAPFSDLQRYIYLIPLAAGAILVALLANGRIATVYASFTAVLFGAITGSEYRVVLWALIVQLCGVYAISTYRERAALLRAGLVVGGMGAIAVLAIESLSDGLDPIGGALYGAALAMIGGAVGAGLLISFSLPVLEWLFKVLTDIRLLELSNVSHPLLSQLAVQAPGSYNHSLVVGTLAEEAAKSIGANSLFCRVAAFYHDIGKMNHPEYFVENQRGINPHDRLSPSMSALIIASHVKDGVKMAREAGLPEQIVDIIPQHHGTRKMTFFYEKARKAADPTMGPVKEEDFRYPGPKPQSREAAIFMIADGVEAAARTVDEPTANRLREVIRKVTNAIVLDGQFDECDLTFSDLDRIQDAFLRLLVSMYHHRVEYPGFEFGKPKGDSRPANDTDSPKVVRSR